MHRILAQVALILSTCLVVWSCVTDDDVCDSQGLGERKRQALLQKSMLRGMQNIQPVLMSATAPLDQSGYESVAELCCSEDMMAFIQNTITSMVPPIEVCDVGGLAGFTLWFDCEDDGQTFETLKTKILEAKLGVCPFVANPGECKPLDPLLCPGNPTATFPPCLTATLPPFEETTVAPDDTTAEDTTLEETTLEETTSKETTTAAPEETTTTTTTTTTESPGSCQGKPKDIFMAIDASKSVEFEGWEKQADFANDLIEALLGKGNPKGHRINAHWFNDVSYPLTPIRNVDATDPNDNKGADCDSTVCKTGVAKNPNDIGTYISKSTDLKISNTREYYSSVRAGSTDHPQVYLTAKKSFSTDGIAANEKILILLTDGETHKGTNCGSNLPNKFEDTMCAGGMCANFKKEKCDNGNKLTDHVCRRDGMRDKEGKALKSCDKGKCMCGLYRSWEFKQDYTLAIVAVSNLHHGSNEEVVFKDQMEAMASPNRFYFARFEDLAKILSQITGDLCK